MRTKRSIVLLFLGVVIAALAAVVFTPPEAAQAQNCFDAQGQPVACPEKPEGKKTPRKTPVPDSTQTPTPTPTPTTIPGVMQSPSGGLPWLWLVCGGLAFLLALLGLLFRFFRGPLGLGSSGLPGGADPFPGGDENGTVIPSENGTVMPPGENATTMPPFDGAGRFERGGTENATVTRQDLGGNENLTATVHDVGDVSPDVSRSIREAAAKLGKAGKNPGGIQ